MLPNIPSFESVPDHWKNPIGPYKQAPSEYGSKWYMVNPFTGPTPWKNEQPIPPKPLHVGFVEIFGKRPDNKDFEERSDYVLARNLWKQDLRYFVSDESPPGEEAALIPMRITAQAWLMGNPMPYEGRYGFMVRFPESLITHFETSWQGATAAIQHTIAEYQISVLQRGISPGPQRHPFVPPDLWTDGDGELI